MSQDSFSAPAPLDATAFQYDVPAKDVASLKRAIANKLMFTVGKDLEAARPVDWLHAAAYAVRDQLVERWMRTTRAKAAQDVKNVYYLSMEFLMGRTFSNALIALELSAPLKQALAELGVDME
ncbi:MAG: glycogen phosphorylase, partial [Rhodoferax sp.]